MTLTAEQEAALSVEGPRVAIAAGAGSGKTYLLCEAIWRDVEEHGIPLESIFVATYNRSAASHLIARLQSRFAEGRGSDRAGLDLSAAWVGTFHALCARIVREHPFAAGVDPEFGELDDAEAGAVCDQALNEALLETDHEGLSRLLESVATTKRVREAVLAVHARLRAAGMENPELEIPAARGPDPADVAEAARLLGEIERHPDARERHHLDITVAKAMLETDAPPSDCPTIYGHATNSLKELIRPCKEVLERVWQGMLEREAVPQLEGLAALLSAFSARYAALKAARGALDYEDLQLAARRILEAERPYGFTRVYVDEFQDANAIQNDILDLLAAQRTVVVGDGTQAIYRFRHADAMHFLGRLRDSAGASLADNHRSDEGLLAALNGLLGRALGDDPSFSRLAPCAPERDELPPMRHPALEVISVDDAAGGKATREQEAAVLAEVIGELTEHGYELRHIAVLFRALTQVGPYREALERAGIPHHLVLGRGFFEHQQVADVLALLSLIENPRNEIALVRALGSPYAAASDAELVAMRRAVGSDQPLIGARETTEPLAGLLATVEQLRPMPREVGLAGIVEAANAACGYDLAVLGLAEGERRYANLKKLVRLAAAFEAVRGPDLRGFLGWLETQDVLGVDPGEATLVDPTLNAVALATIHAVKGQEFPVVILADASHGTPIESGVVLCDRNGRAGIAVRRPGASSSTALLGLQEFRKAEADEADAEERRLLYVALTRAQRHAIVIGRPDAGRGITHHKVLFDALQDHAEGVFEIDGGVVAHRRRVMEPEPAREFMPDPVVPTTTEAPTPVVAPPPEIDPVRGRRLSFSALWTLGTCARRFHLEYECGLTGRADAVVSDAKAQSGSIWGGAVLGDLVHRFLASHDWSKAPAPGWAGEAASLEGLTSSPADAARAERMVADLLSGPIAERVRGGTGWFERAFALELDGAVISGAIDLMLEDRDGRVALYDWKTHALDGRDRRELEETYSLQMAIYGLAALRAGAPEVELSWLFLDDQSKPLEREVTQADIAALEAEVRACLDVLRCPGRQPATSKRSPICSQCPGLEAGCPVATAA